MAVSPVYKENDSGEKKQIEPWGSLRWVASASIGNATGLTLGYVTINSGKENPRHAHPTCEEVLYLIKGWLILMKVYLHLLIQELPYEPNPLFPNPE